MPASTRHEPVWIRYASPLVRKWCAVKALSYGSLVTYCDGRIPTTDDVEVGVPTDIERCRLCSSRTALKTEFPRVVVSMLAPYETNVVEVPIEDFADSPTPGYEEYGVEHGGEG